MAFSSRLRWTPSRNSKYKRTLFPRSTGAATPIINGTIKAGTNEFHGDLYEFLRNSDLDAKNFFNTGAKAKLEQNQFGATLGGPIKRNRTFFFSNYEGTTSEQGNSSNTVVPIASPTQRGLFGFVGLGSATEESHHGPAPSEQSNSRLFN